MSSVSLSTTYKINVGDVTLTPDPTNKATRDESFINLTSLKAACILVNAEVRQYTAQGIFVRDGSSAVSLSRNPKALALMQTTYCGEYEKALYQYATQGLNGGAVGECIVGPIKAWYYEGGYSSEFDYGTYRGPSRIGGGPWYGG